MIDYEPHRWRSSLFALRGSMFRVIAVRSLLVTLAAAGLTGLHYNWPRFDLPNAPVTHNLVATALGLLLVFRTNQAYDRWWEGRKLWGALVNTSRNLARQTSVHLAHTPERLTRVLALVDAFPQATIAVLRLQPWQASRIAAEDAESVAARVHAPTAIAQRITWHLEQERRAGHLADIVFTSIDANCQALVDIVGKCERIHATPLPFAYVVHLRRALVLFCVSLPLSLVNVFGWANLFVVFAVSGILLGIEEIGVEIEDPFGTDDNDLPLELIAQNISRNVDTWQPR